MPVNFRQKEGRYITLLGGIARESYICLTIMSYLIDTRVKKSLLLPLFYFFSNPFSPGVKRTFAIGLLFAHKLIGNGLGTALAVLGVGRVIALSNHMYMDKLTSAAGIS